MNVRGVDEGLEGTLFFCRSRRQSNSLVLIPIADSCHVQRQVVVVTMFNGSLQALVKENGIADEEAIHMRTSQPTEVVVYTRIAEVRMREGLLGAPCRIEEVFRTGTKQRSFLFAIDEEHVITFAIPHGSRTVNIVVDTHEMSLAFGIDEHIVVLTGQVGSLRACGTPFSLAFRQSLGQAVVIPGMEASHVFRKLLHLHIIHIEVEGVDVSVRLVLDFNTRTFLERHHEIA